MREVTRLASSAALVGVLVVSHQWATVRAAQDCAAADRLVTEARARGTSGASANSETLQAYERALSTCPTHAEALNALGDTLERLGRLEDAANAYRRAALAKPGWALPIFGLGDAYRRLQRDGEALYWYRKGLDVDPNDAETQARVRELTKDDPPDVVTSRSIRDTLDASRSTGVLATALALNERVLPFAYGSSNPTPAAQAQIRELAFALLDLLGAPRSLGVLDAAGPPIAEIIGHTDSRGSDTYNMELGRRRAQSVIDTLVREYRIPRARVIVKSLGESRPLCQEDTDACRTQNRRVEIRRP